LKNYIKWGVWRVGVCPFHIWNPRFLKVKQLPCRKQIRTTRRVLKCGIGKRWRKSVGLICENKVLHRVKEERKIYMQQKRARLKQD
jgi:hypothetical protein